MFLATRRISLETGCRSGLARRLRNSFFLVILTGPPTSRYTYRRIRAAHVREEVAWPHILRGNQGGSRPKDSEWGLTLFYRVAN